MGSFLGPHVEVKGFLVPKDQEVIVLLKRVWGRVERKRESSQRQADKRMQPGSQAQRDGQAQAVAAGLPCHGGWGAQSHRCPSPDEASAGHNLCMAVVDGLALQAERVPFHTAVPWDGIKSTCEDTQR